MESRWRTMAGRKFDFGFTVDTPDKQGRVIGAIRLTSWGPSLNGLGDIAASLVAFRDPSDAQ